MKLSSSESRDEQCRRTIKPPALVVSQVKNIIAEEPSLLNVPQLPFALDNLTISSYEFGKEKGAGGGAFIVDEEFIISLLLGTNRSRSLYFFC